MKLVAERTVAHKVWQLLPVAQARRGQRSLSSKLEEDEKKMANQGRRRSSVQDVSGCACGYVRLRPGRVERGGRLLRPSHPGTRRRRPTVSGMSICAGVGRMKGEERGNGQPADGGSSHLGTRGRRLAACGRGRPAAGAQAQGGGVDFRRRKRK